MKNTRTNLTRHTARILAGSILALLAAPAIHADDAAWTGLNSAIWSDIGGFGNWDNAPGPVPGTGETATFNAASANTTIDLGAGVTITTVKFDTALAAAYTIGTGGQTLTLDPAGAVNMTSTVGADQTVNANIVLGTGNTTDAFTFTNNSLSNSLIFGGAINSGANTGTKTVTLTGAGATIVDGLISDGAGTVAVTKTGNGTLTLNAANTYTGQTTITAGTVIAGTTDALGTGAALLVNGGTLAIGGNSNTVGAVTLTSGSITGGAVALLTGTSFAVQSGTISARLAGAGATLTKTTSGTVTLSAAATNLRSGLTSINGGTLVMGTAGALGTTGNITFGGGTLKYNSGATTDYSARFKNSTSAITLDANGLTLTFAGAIDSSNTGGLVINGNGTVTISGTNTYTGGTTVNSGSVNLGHQNGFGAGTLTLAGGVNFQTSNFEGNGAGGALPNALILTGGKVTMNVAFGGPKDIWINTSVSGAGGFTIIGSGRDQGLTLDGAKTFTGGVTLGTVGSAGDTPNVSISDNASLGTGILRSELLSPSTSAGALRINANLSGVANNVVIASGARLVVRMLGGNSATLTGVISDEGVGGRLITNDSGTLTLTNANTFKGTTTIGTGTTIALGNALALQNSTVVYSAGTLSFGALTAATLGGLSGTQSLALSNPMALTVGGNNSTTTYSGTLSGTGGSLNKTGTGTLTLTAAPTYDGATTINGGTLNMSGTVANSSVDVNSGGALGVTSLVTALNLGQNLTFNGTSAYQIGSGASGTGSTAVTGNLTVGGTPTLRLTSDNTTPTTGVKDIIIYGGSITGSGTAWTVDSSQLNSGGSQVSDWIGGNGTWVTPANWTQQGFSGVVSYDNPNKKVQLTLSGPTNITPIFSTIATIAPGVAAAVTGPASATTVSSLAIGDGSFANSLTLQAGGPLTVTGVLTVNPLATLTASGAALSAGTLNLSGGSVTVGVGSSAGTVNLTSGTLAATVGGNELAVSTKLVKTTASTVTISAGTTPFKVGGSNLVSSIDKVMVQGGTTSLANPGTITLTDVGTQWSGTNATLVSNNFTVTPGANVLVVTVNQRTLSPTGSAYTTAVHPTVTYNGVAMTLDNAAGGPYGYGQINGFVNSQVFYMLNAPTGAANPLDVSFPYAGTDFVVNAFTLAGVSTTVPVKTNGNVVETTNTPSNIGISLTGVTAGSAVVSAYMQRFANAVSTTTSSGALNTSGTGGGSGDYWSYVGPNTASAGALALGVNPGTVTITHSSSSAARAIFAAAAFAPASSAVTLSSTAVNVTSTNTLDFGGAPSVSLGALTMESGSSLTMANAPAAGVSFSSIVGNGSSQIAGGVPISLRSPSPTVTVNAGHLNISAAVKLEAGTVISTAAGSSVTFGGNITTPVSSGDFNVVKSGLGTMNITGTVFAAGSSPNRIINMTGGTTNFTNATVHVSSLITQTNNNVYMTATNSIIDIDDEGWYHGGLRVGWGNGVYSYAMNGGSLTLNPNAEIIRVAGNGNTGRAILSLDGGATVSTGGIDVGETDNTYGEINIRDSAIANSWEFRIGVSKGLGVVNQLGATSSVVNDLPVILTYRMGQTGCWGIYNLNAGTLKTDSIVSGDGNTQFNGNRAFVNFHGGTLIPKANSGNFIYSTLTGPNAGSVSAPQLMVYSEGAIIDTDGKNITIGEKLLAPTGQGVSATTIVLAGPSQGSGYRGEPVITIGNTANFSATAVANMVDDGTGNGTFKIASITVTNPGVNFTSAPALNIYGGDPTLAATLPATVPIAANVSGGLTKNGLGTLTLSAANTYRGNTLVNTGVLALGNVNAVQFSTLNTGTVGAQNVTFTVAGTNTYNLGGLQGADDLSAGTNSLSIGANNTNTTSTGGVTAASVTKVGTGTLDLNGANQNYDTLTVNDGTLNVNGTLTTTTAAVTVTDTAGGAPTKLRFGTVSQTLGSLTIGAGATVVFTSGTASGSFGGGDSGGKAPGFGGTAAVPEPGTLGLLLVGALSLLQRRRRS